MALPRPAVLGQHVSGMSDAGSYGEMRAVNAKRQITKPDDFKPDFSKPDGFKPDGSKQDDFKPDGSKSKADDIKPDGSKTGSF